MNTSDSPAFFSDYMLLLYKSTVTLNNLAVCMMQDGCYEHAYDTFKDGLQAIQQAAGGRGRDGGLLRVEAQVQRARHRLLLTQPQRSRSDPCFVRRMMTLQTVRQDAPLTNLEPYQGNPQCASVIQITDSLDLIDRDARDGDYDLHVPSAILLYNLAVSSYCRSQTTEVSSAAAAKLSRNSVRLCRLCQTILEDVIQSSEHNFLVTRAILFLSMALKLRLHVLATATSAAARQEAQTCHESLKELDIVAAMLLCQLDLGCDKIAPAA